MWHVIRFLYGSFQVTCFTVNVSLVTYRNALSRKILKSTEVYLFDCRSDIYVWYVFVVKHTIVLLLIFLFCFPLIGLVGALLGS